MVTKARIEITAADKTKAAFRSAQGSLKRFKATALSLGAVLGVGVFKAATTGAINFADSIDKAAKAASVSTDFMQKMRFAGDQLGVSQIQVDEGFRRFTRRLGEFANSGAGPAAKAIEQLGIEIKDAQGNFRGSEQIFRDFTRAMEGVKSEAQRGAIAAQIFGDDAGPKLRLLLDKGIAGLDDLSSAAESVGAILSRDVIDNAVEAKDAAAKLASVLKSQLTAAFVNLAPVITAASNGLVKFSSFVRDVFGSNAEYSGLQFLDDQIGKTIARIRELNQEINQDNLSVLGTEKAILELKALGKQYARLIETREKLAEPITGIATGQPGSEGSGISIKPPVGLTSSQKAFEKWKASIIDVGKETEVLQQKIDFLDESMLSGALTTEEHRLALEKLTGAQSAHAGELEKTLDDTKDKTEEIGKGAIDMGFAFESAFEDAVLGGEEFSDVLDGLLKDLQKVALRQLITAPAGNALAGGISRTFPGFASGGSFDVGGSGGTDSQLVAFNATPGEHVSVTPPGQTQAGGTIVNIINNSGANTEIKRSNDSSGRELINVIIGQVAQNITSGGPVAQAMQGVFGVRRQGVLRT